MQTMANDDIMTVKERADYRRIAEQEQEGEQK